MSDAEKLLEDISTKIVNTLTIDVEAEPFVQSVLKARLLPLLEAGEALRGKWLVDADYDAAKRKAMEGL